MRLIIFVIAYLLLSLAEVKATQDCDGQPGWDSMTFTAMVNHPDLYRHEAHGLVFLLRPTELGWRIEMTKDSGLPIIVFAPPRHPVATNPVNIAGWHFRNADNTGPNTGDVNAPQHLRRFLFGSMADKAAYDQPGGVGELTIKQITLTPPEAGSRARMNSLSFHACLTWQALPQKLDPIISADPGVAFETVVSAMLGCGFDDQTYKLSERMADGLDGGQAAFLHPDLDGDRIVDIAIPITRRSDDAPGIALCLLGTKTLMLAGYDGRIGKHLDPSYFETADFWGIHQGPVGQGVAEGPAPRLRGDAILLGKEDSSSVLLFLTEDMRIDSYWQGD